ncbi:MAG TPA: phosphatase PAP2 family protein [Candidatus Alistipes faecavium]|nr:phosphatase PAP2 family protein [Candidatus Alistipes faecavium]
MHDFDQRLFLLLNFDGGPVWDRVMLAVSGTTMWIPLYVLILWLVWRRAGWRGTLTFLVLMAAAVGLADMVAGIFKHTGVLGGLLPDLEPRLRPMFTPSLEGLDIPPDSLAAIRRAALPGDWAVHVPRGAVAGRYGTVSAHASTIVALALLSAAVIRRRWFTILVTLCALLICYSRIYLAKHFPMDILWGALLGAALGGVAYWIYHRLTTRKKKEAK